MKTLALALTLLASPAFACNKVPPTHVGSTQIYLGDLGDKCFISINPMASTNLVYRSYAIFDDGLLMAFNSYGDGEDVSRLTGAREFYFFPRTGKLSVTGDEAAGTITAVMANGDTLVFNANTSEPVSFGRGTVKTANRVAPDNAGGIEIPSYNGLILDTGFRQGGSPAGRRGATSVFRDASGGSCTVTNSEIFEYAGGEHWLKHNDKELREFLRGRCPSLRPAA